MFEIVFIAALSLAAAPRAPLHRTIDVNVGDTTTVTLPSGTELSVKVRRVDVRRDAFRDAVREAKVTVEIDGAAVELVSGNYRLPVTVGVAQVDCPVTKDLYTNANGDAWGLEKDVRLRFWPAGSPWVEPGTFRYPVRQKWFASGTQMANEPTYVDGGEVPSDKTIYYHYGLDIGGAEGLVEVIAATDGLVVSSGLDRLAGHEDTPVSPRYDVVYLLDDRGWYYRYSHMKVIDPEIKIGAKVAMGQRIGLLGKEGGSGGWSHLHFEARARQPSGKWGIEEGYAFIWQSYLEEYKPEVIAVARPHHLVAVGEEVTLDGSRSWSRNGPIRLEWLSAPGNSPRRTYDRPGVYSEVLKATDALGNVAYDFAYVQVSDPKAPADVPPSIQAAYAPTLGISPGDRVTFKVRTFRTTDGQETWNFGDGTPEVKVKSDGNAHVHDPNGFAVTEHSFEKPGDYVVRVSRGNARGQTATAHLWVHVEEK